MYESNENQIEWGPILKKCGIFGSILLVVVIIIVLVTKCTNKKVEEPPQDNVSVTLSEQLDVFENALLKYLNVDNLPKEINSSKTIRIKMLEDKELISDLKDKENNSCMSNESFAEVTRFENNYAINLSLTCGSQKENRIIYVGCFSECNGGVCKGTAESTGGICVETPVTEQPDNNNTSTPSSTPSDQPNKPSTNTTNGNNNSTTTKKPNTTTTTKKPATTTKKPNTTTKPSSSGNRPPKVPEVMYEYKKCSTYYTCDIGKLSGNKCITEKSNRNYMSLLIRTARSKTPNLHELNQSNRIYVYNGYYDNYHQYTEYYCNDQSYNVDLNARRCYKDITEKVENPAKENESCQYTWSYSTSLDGWTRTGRTQ